MSLFSNIINKNEFVCFLHAIAEQQIDVTYCNNIEFGLQRDVRNPTSKYITGFKSVSKSYGTFKSLNKRIIVTNQIFTK